MNSISDIQKIETFTPKAPAPDFPAWIIKLLKRQDQLNKRYEKAHDKFAEAYNEFLGSIVEINEQFGTTFTLEQAAAEFEGMEADCGCDDDDEDDEDE
jgi:hypothetical protein